MKKSICLLVLAFISLQTFCVYGQSISETLYDEAKLLNRLEELSLDAYEGRRTGEKGNALARTYIKNEFKKLNVFPLQKTYDQVFNFKSDEKTYQGVNILGSITGTDFPEKYIIISAHYDHLGIQHGKIYNGADDNASGVCALFAFAEYFKKYPPKHSVVLAAFDAEEMGLKGSKYFVKHTVVAIENIELNINMDMIGRNVNNELYAVGARHTAKIKGILDNFKNKTTVKLLQGHDGSDGKQDWTLASDHAPFHLQKIPFVYFGEEDHPDYHKETDEFQHIIPTFYKNSVSLIINVFKDIDTVWNKR